MTVRVVSIITPCLDPGARLERCIDSVKSQDHEPVEHIVIDGGSTDGTVDLLKTQHHLRWISEPDSGQASAINKGLRIATGDVIGWLNADDVLLPGAASAVVDALNQTQAGWAYGNIEVVEGEASRTWVPPDDPGRHILGLGKGGVIPQPGSFLTSETWKMVGELDEQLNLAMDFDLWLRLLDRKIPWVHVKQTLARFEIHRDSKTGVEGLAAFYREEANVLFKRGRTRLASIALGRAIAHEALAGGRVSRDRLESRLASTPREDRRLISAGAAAEASLLEAAAGRVPWGFLLQTDPWLVRETRNRLAKALADKIWRANSS